MNIRWEYLDGEREHEKLMNSKKAPPVYGVDYILDRDGDILVPTKVGIV